MTRVCLAVIVGALTLSPHSSAFVPLMPLPRTTTTTTTTTSRYMTAPEKEETTVKYNPLGIDIGKQMDFLNTAEERAELKAELKGIIDSAVKDGIDDLGKLHDKWQRDLIDGQAFAKLEVKMNQNGRLASYRFNRKVDNLVDNFFNITSASRAETHKLALEDIQRQQQEIKDRERAKRKAKEATQRASWERTNDAWDKEWDDW